MRDKITNIIRKPTALAEAPLWNPKNVMLPTIMQIMKSPVGMPYSAAVFQNPSADRVVVIFPS
jgi:hypothetical protein